MNDGLLENDGDIRTIHLCSDRKGTWREVFIQMVTSMNRNEMQGGKTTGYGTRSQFFNKEK